MVAREIPDSAVSHPASRFRQAAVALAFLGAYAGLEWLSFIHEYKGVPITPWNPGLGLLFALMILGGPVYALVLFAGVVISETLVLKTNLQWPIILGIAAIIAAVYGAAAWLARVRFALDVSLRKLRDVGVLLGAGLAGALFTTLLLSLLLVLEPNLSWGDVVIALVPLLVGDTIGIAVVTPLVMRAMHPHRLPMLSAPLITEIIFYAALIAGSLWIIGAAGAVNGVKLFYLLFVPVVLSALRFGLDGACVALALAQLGLVIVLRFFAADAQTFTEFQILMLVLTATGLIVGAVVTERERSEEHARDAERRFKEKEAEAVHAARFTLVSGMASALAHEINQPMTAARALARSAQELIRKPEADLARADTNLTNMIAQVDLAGAIVRRMREFLRRGHPRVSTVDAANVLDDALMLARSEAAAKDIRLVLKCENGLPPLYGDRVQLQQVVLNLVRNSIDSIASAKRGGEVVIAARHLFTPGRVEFSVWDNGPGISEDIAERLFEPLMTSKHEGLGLGLPICTSIVEAHGGKIWLHSRDPGATEFRFTIPTGDKRNDQR
ncbi:MAG: MASE1 domain-containing protein [Xanthobacteraceae bacterium]|nr:MASE1 domain-containing protein [Xanthobacteraceae bacterium]MCW5677070.1 MASE1 domain-containing protein [Xanthobacteraceae bacterium]